MVLRVHNEIEDLTNIMHDMYDVQRFGFIYHSIYNEIHNLFPYTSLYLYSYVKDETTYYYAYKDNKYIKPSCYSACDGVFKADNFAKGFEQFALTLDFFEDLRPILFVGEKCFIDEIHRSFQTHAVGFVATQHPMKKFYMTEKQRKMAGNVPLPKLPQQYKLGSATAHDAEVITGTWTHAEPREVPQTRMKLAAFPSSCVRFEGQPVAFEMIDHTGYMNHLFVMKEHRKKGLGTSVELDLVKKCIRNNILPFKCIETFNEFVIASAEKSELWTKAKNDDGSDTIVVVLYIGVDE